MKNTITTLSVDGMTCPSCVRHIDQALREVEGVTKVEVRIREGKALVTHDAVDVDALIGAIREAGYDAAIDP